MTTPSPQTGPRSSDVGQALASPSGILAVGVGAAVGIVATFGTAGLAAPVIGALVGGALGGGARAIAARRPPRSATTTTAGDRDVFSIGEPWRHQVIDALRAQTRLEEAERTFPEGPLRQSVATVASRIDQAVEECWKVALRGDRIARGRARVNDTQIRNDLERLQRTIAHGQEPTATQQRTADSLGSQLEAVGRMDALMAQTDAQLSLLNAQLDEAVTQAIELSVTNQVEALDPTGADVATIVDNLSALRHAMDDLDRGGSGTTPTSAPPAGP